MTSPLVSVITPAFRAQQTIVRAVRSVEAQTIEDWEMIIVADDDADYADVLARSGITDKRIRHLATGSRGSGSPIARNLGLEAAVGRYIAILDADDALHPQKLSLALPAVVEHGLVSTALQITDADMKPLRTIGEGADMALAPGAYKFTNISMDSMLVYDREKADPRFDTAMPRFTDIDFLLQLFKAHKQCFHLGTPLHTYVKEPQSISNKSGASEGIIAIKQLLITRLQQGYYPLAGAEGPPGLIDFYQRSLAAEKAFGAVLDKDPSAIFEDHLENFLTASSTSPE